MVFSTANSSHNRTEDPAISSANSTALGPQNPASQSPLFNTGFGRYLWKRLKCEGFSWQAAEEEYLSFEPSTRKSYNTTVNLWDSFCASRSIDPLHPSHAEIADFFLDAQHSHTRKGVTLDHVGSAVAWILPPKNRDFLCSRDITKIISTAKKTFPSLPRITAEVWDPEIVLQMFRKWPYNDNLDILSLSKKVVTLICLTTLRRCIDLTRLLLKPKYFHRDLQYFQFILTSPPKTAKANQRSWILQVHEFPRDRRVCPYQALTVYLRKTRDHRATDFIFTVTTGKGTPAHNETIGHWIKATCTLLEAGVPNTFSPHSTRAAGASAAIRSGWSLQQVLSYGHWKDSNVFFNHYCRDVSVFGRKVSDFRHHIPNIVHRRSGAPPNPLVRSANHKLAKILCKRNRKKDPLIQKPVKTPYITMIAKSPVHLTEPVMPRPPTIHDLFIHPAERITDDMSVTSMYSSSSYATRIQEVEALDAPPAALPTNKRPPRTTRNSRGEIFATPLPPRGNTLK